MNIKRLLNPVWKDRYGQRVTICWPNVGLLTLGILIAWILG